jgi:hypothetical protein
MPPSQCLADVIPISTGNGGVDYAPKIFRPSYVPGPQEEKLKEVLLARPQLPGNYDQCQLSRTIMMLMNQIIPAAINTYLPTSNQNEFVACAF